MDTYFARHTHILDVDDETRLALWRERRIAIHFPNIDKQSRDVHDSESLDPEDYPNDVGGTQLRKLLALATSGGYVYAEYHGQDNALIGLVRPGSSIELWRGTWGARHNRAGLKAILKSLRLEKARELEPSEFKRLAVARPRMGTLMKWKIIGDDVANLVEGRTEEPSLDRLTPVFQEAMCAEYLRCDEAVRLGLPRLARLLLLGKTMRHIDIEALAEDGSSLCAQVTYKRIEDAKSKLKDLEKYASENSHLLFFCNCDTHEIRNGVHIIPLDHAFRRLSTGPLGREWLRAVCGSG